MPVSLKKPAARLRGVRKPPAADKKAQGRGSATRLKATATRKKVQRKARGLRSS